MRTAVSQLVVKRPKTLEQALRMLSRKTNGKRPVPLAGGTDLFVYLNAGSFPDRVFLDLWPLRSLRGIRKSGKETVLGALTTFSEIRESTKIQKRFPSLVEAAAVVGGRQIQNRATVAGNIANASPAADSVPVLMALDGRVRAQSVRGEREIPLDEFYLGYRRLALDPDELIVAVILPKTAPRTMQFFRKVGTRMAQSISKVVIAATIRLDRKKRVEDVRIVLGSVAPVTLRARKTEQVLIGERASGELADRAILALDQDISPIDDIRSEREYRREIAGNILRQFLRVAEPGFARR